MPDKGKLNNKKLTFGIFFICIIVITGCKVKRTDTVEEYIKWLSNKENGTVQEKRINGIELKLMYLPPEYKTYLDINSGKVSFDKRDSLIKMHSRSRSFMLTIAPQENLKEGEGTADIMMNGIQDYQEYNKRMNIMNFHMQEYIHLDAGGSIHRPVIATMENLYGLGNKRNILLVFVPDSEKADELTKAEKLDFVYEDQLFGLGTNHFIFKTKDIDNLPSFPFK